MRDLWEQDKQRVEYNETDLNEADICTKNLPLTLHSSHQHTIRTGCMKVMTHYGQISIPYILSDQAANQPDAITIPPEDTTS